METTEALALAVTDPSWTASETPYLQQLKATHRARARCALRWRPRFLKALASSCSWASALKGARVTYNTVRAHQKNDAEFAAQVSAAEECGAQLLHDACWKEAVEGHLEPVYFQGKIVGQIRKYDPRIQIEMLRAHIPEKFQRRSAVRVEVGGSGRGLVIGPEEHAKLCAARRESLLRLRAAYEVGNQPLPVRLED